MAMKKTYLVQTWNKEGGQENHYEVLIESERELADLKKFLKQKHGHVLVTVVAEKKLKAAAATPFRRGK